ASAIALAACPAIAQDDFPSETIQVVTHSGVGGGTDVNARMLIKQVEATSDATMEIVNKIGGAGMLALQYVNSRPADGHTIAFVTPSHLYGIAQGRSPFEFEELIPLVRATDDPNVIIVKAGGDIQSFDDLIEQSKSGGGLKWGTTHVGGIDHIAIHKLSQAAGFEYEVVPFEGGAEVATNIVGGNVAAALANVSEAGALLDAGEVIPIAVLSEERVEGMPDVPTAVEKGYDVVAATVRGLVAPPGVPEERVEKLREILLEATQTEEYKEFLKTNGMTADAAAGHEEWAKQMKRIYEDGQEVLSELGML
ncbi:MAG TPA: tripartite tricarboxylate transporter substrate binding protein, partial [Geminicoccaceae bacterium]